MQEIYLAPETQAGQDAPQVAGHPMQSHLASYQFGPYELRIRTRDLFKHGTTLKLRSQPFQVLQARAERAGGGSPPGGTSPGIVAQGNFREFRAWTDPLHQ